VSDDGLTRRDFLRTGSGAAVAGLLGLPGAAAALAGESSRVVLVRDPAVVTGDGGVDPKVLARMLDEAVAALLDEPLPTRAWGRLVRPDDVVGLKTNLWRNLPTPPALEEAIVRRVRETGVAEKSISVDDHGIRTNPVFQRATALINARPSRIHYWAGLGTCLKNYIMFVPRPADYHDNGCESLGAIWRLPEVEGKTRLNVLVMLTPLFHGVGPHAFAREFTWPYAGLVVGIDPVAVDATGARIIQAKRADYFGEERPISPPLTHILAADRRYGLGNASAERIQLVRLGRAEGSLI
jgi:hypothetical protein